jgi:exopolysaccharide biosynthesis operon protein EpsL
VAFVCSVYSMPALSDTFQPFVNAEIEHEDNLFRRSDTESSQTSSRADTSRSAGGGLRFSRPVSRQLFSGIADFSTVKFDRNRQLDYLRKDIRGEWHWFLASHFEGRIGGVYTQQLASFADFDAVQRNLRVNKRQYADGSWRFHPSWQWRTGVSKDEFTYELISQRSSDRVEDTLTTGIDYLARSGSTIGLQLRRLEGSYPNALPVNGPGSFVNGYIQDEAKINILWMATGSTQLSFLGGWVQRKQEALVNRDDSGTNARMVINWTPASRMKLVAQAWREFTAIDGALIDSALTKGGSAVMTWEFSAKTHAEVDLKSETREFTPYAGAAGVTASPLASDSRDTASVGLVYKPLRSITVKASLFRDQRKGSLSAGTNSYKANGASLNAVLQFH